MLFVAVDRQAQVVGAVERLRIQMRVAGGFLARHHLHVRGRRVVLVQAGMQLFAVYPGRQQARLQRNRQHDALAERAVGRHEHRALRQPRMGFNLGRVLVRQAQAVQLNAGPCTPPAPS
ncbi:hypothetical protein D3C73_1440920 [compost metagenome]